MKKVVLLMESWKRYFTSAWPIGFQQKIQECQEDVSLYIFNSSDGLSHSESYQTGEYNIFRLPDFKDFDGAILDINNIKSKSIHEELIARLKEANIPLLSIAYNIDGFRYVGIDNYAAMKEIIAHLHENHGCTSFYFVMGPRDNFETQERARALRDYMTENALPFSEDDFYFENYEYDTGVHGFKILMKTKKQLPDAIICCNDNIAVGVCEAAKEYGYSVPKDFLVTGFDDFDKASYYIPRITTVGHVREDVGNKCASILLDIWAGKEVEQNHYTKTTSIFQESCGCTRPPINANVRLKNNIIFNIKADYFEELNISLEYDLAKCKSPQEMMTALVKYIQPMNCKAFYVAFDEALFEVGSPMDEVGRQNILADNMFRLSGYPNEMQVSLAVIDGKRNYEAQKKIGGLFPFYDSQESSVFLYMPLHFQDRTVGYVAIEHPVQIMETQYLFQVVGTLTTALENYHKNEILEKMNSVLTDLYVKDGATGLYNRLGMMKYAPEFIEKAFSVGKSVLVMFIDMDRLKYINDNFGHAQGDFAIKAVAKAMMNYSAGKFIPVRNGGDEYILIQEYFSEECTQELINNIKNDLIKQSVKMSLPFDLSVSVGYSVMRPDSSMTFEMAINEADDKMYEEKAAKKVGRQD